MVVGVKYMQSWVNTAASGSGKTSWQTVARNQHETRTYVCSNQSGRSRHVNSRRLPTFKFVKQNLSICNLSQGSFISDTKPIVRLFSLHDIFFVFLYGIYFF